MVEFFNTTRKAWAAAATAFSGAYVEALPDGVAAGEWGTIAVFTVVAWIVTWAIPNKETV